MTDELPEMLLAALNAAVNEIKKEYEIETASIHQHSYGRVIIDISYRGI